MRLNGLIKKIMLTMLFAGIVFTVAPTQTNAQYFAQNEQELQLEAAGGNSGAGLTATDPRWIIGNVIRVLLGLVGIILFCFMFYAGYLWLTAAGSEEQVEHAKTIIKNSIIGLLVVLLSLSITQFILFYSRWAASGQIPVQQQPINRGFYQQYLIQ